jgi:hypothetical protein
MIAVALASLTPTGRAIATDVGQLVGIGDQPSQGVPEGESAVVIGTGDTARSYRYEVVAETNRGGTDRSETCVVLEFPELPGQEAGDCLTDASRRSLPEDEIAPFIYGAQSQFGPDAALIVQGLATLDVASVTVTYQSADGSRGEASVEMSSLDGDLSRQIGVDDETGFFFAFLPQAILEGEPNDTHTLSACSVERSLATVEVTAYDEAGNPIVTKDLGDPWYTQSLLLSPPSGFASSLRAPRPGENTEGRTPVEPYQPGCPGRA